MNLQEKKDLVSRLQEEIIIEEIRELFDYHPDGYLTYRYKSTRNKVGDRAGSPNERGYLLVNVYKVQYPVHRLIWCWHHGKFPDNFIDHINNERHDNRIENLRDVTQQENARNRKDTNANDGIFCYDYYRRHGLPVHPVALEKHRTACRLNAQRRRKERKGRTSAP